MMVRTAKKFADMEPEILEPGYAGEIDTRTLSFIKRELRRRPGLRGKCGIGKDQQRFAVNDIRHVALFENQHTTDCACDWSWLTRDD